MGWNDPALRGVFCHTLNDRIKYDLATREEPDTLDELFTLAIEIDGRSRERFRAKPLSSTRNEPKPDSPVPKQFLTLREESPECMQIGRARLCPHERQKRIANNWCLYCGSPQYYWFAQKTLSTSEGRGPGGTSIFK